MKNRNQHRLLNDEQIKDIITQMADDFKKYPVESAEHLINFYLNGDVVGMFEIVSDWIETAEDEIKRQINNDIIEDSFNNDDYTPSYGF
jgi:hypothetical protein